MRQLVAIGLVVVCIAGAAYAEDRDVDWRKRPTSDDLIGVWPRDAWAKNLSGKVILDCQVSEQGALFGCAIAEETPSDAGFGLAALALTPQFLMKPAIEKGKPVAGRVRIPINFKMPQAMRASDYGDGPMFQSLSNVSWVAGPSYDQVVAAYPQRARDAGAGGRATLNCRFDDAGRVSSCETLVEEPRGMGFAAASKALSAHFVGPLSLSDGRSTRGVWTMISFTFAPEMLDAQRRLIGKPQWAALPTGEAVIAGYPRQAAAAGVGTARVVLNCRVAEEGRLQDCLVAEEDPVGLGFGQAALGLGPMFQARPWTAEGLPTIGGRVRIPIRYQFPSEPAP